MSFSEVVLFTTVAMNTVVCQSGAFGFESGRGCDLCNCGPASVSPDCDVYSGQCQCRPGVTGRKCDQCEQGYWNYGPRGCQSEWTTSFQAILEFIQPL